MRNPITCILQQILLDDPVEEDCMGKPCGKHERSKKHIHNYCLWNLKQRKNLGELVIDGKSLKMELWDI
jgi:hypothetical protein